MTTHAMTVCFQNIRSLMCEATAAVTAIALTDSLLDPALSGRIARLQPLDAKMTVAKNTLASMQLDSPSLGNVHVLFLLDFNSLLTVLIPQVTRMFSAVAETDNPKNISRFSQLWSILFMSNTLFISWPARLPTSDEPCITLLHTSFNAMLTMLLHMTRQAAWSALPSCATSGLHVDLCVALSASMKFLENITRSPSHTFLAQLEALPSGMLSLLCCIISDKLGTSPRAIPASHAKPRRSTNRTFTAQAAWTAHITASPTFLHTVLQPLVLLLTDLQACRGSPDSVQRGVSAFLQTPAVIHSWKVILLTPDEHNESLHGVFNDMICLHNLVCSTPASHPPPVSDKIHISVPSAEAGTPAEAFQHSILPTFAQSWEADKQLLRLLCKHMNEDMQFTSIGYSLQVNLLRSLFARLTASPTEAASAALRGSLKGCLLAIASQVITHSQIWMQHHLPARVESVSGRSSQQRKEQKEFDATRKAAVKWLFSIDAMLLAPDTMDFLSKLALPVAVSYTSDPGEHANMQA